MTRIWSYQVRFRLYVPGDVHWMKQSKLNLPNKFGEIWRAVFRLCSPDAWTCSFYGNFRRLFPLRKTEPRNQLRTLRLLSTRSRILLPRPCWINAWFVWQNAWFGHDLGPLWWGSTKVDIKYQMSVRVIRQESVSALTFNCFFKWWPVIKLYFTLHMTTCNVNTRDRPVRDR